MGTSYPGYAGYGPAGYPPPGYGYGYPAQPQAAAAPRKPTEAELLSGYLEDDSWKRPDGYSTNDGDGIFGSGVMNSGVVGGMLAMLAGILLFFVPLMFGFFFPYSGILFILGVIGVIRGLLNGQ